MYHVVLEAELGEPAVQVKPERTRLLPGHEFTGELLPFFNEDHELMAFKIDGSRVTPLPLAIYLSRRGGNEALHSTLTRKTKT